MTLKIPIACFLCIDDVSDDLDEKLTNEVDQWFSDESENEELDNW